MCAMLRQSDSCNTAGNFTLNSRKEKVETSRARLHTQQAKYLRAGLLRSCWAQDPDRGTDPETGA